MVGDVPLFSIIVPAYNAEGSIDSCLDSLLGLTGDDYEIVVIDDGSTDLTAELVRQRAEGSKCLHLISQENAGVYQARRKGCAKANGAYCLFVDADDRVEPCILASLRSVLDGKPDMVVFNALSGGELLCAGDWLKSLNLTIARNEIVAGNLMNPIWNKCIRRSLVNCSSVDDVAGRLVYGEDAIQVASILDSCNSVVGLDLPLYRYEINAESVTSTIDPLLRFKQAIRKQEILSTYIEKWGLGSTGRPGFNSNCLIYCADYCRALAKRGDYRGMRKLASEAFFVDAADEYTDALLTRNQKIMVAMLRTKSVFATRFLCLLAAIRREA